MRDSSPVSRERGRRPESGLNQAKERKMEDASVRAQANLSRFGWYNVLRSIKLFGCMLRVNSLRNSERDEAMI